MSSPSVKFIAAALAAVVLLLVGFVAGVASADPSSTVEPRAVALAPLSPNLFGAETDVAGRLVEAKRNDDMRVWNDAIAAEQARLAALAAVASPATARPSGGPSSCDGHVVPAYILQRESGCSYDAYNPSGCGGSGCIGLYQLDAKHFQGTCAGLDTSPAGQDACAQRLVDVAGLSPWGG